MRIYLATAAIIFSACSAPESEVEETDKMPRENKSPEVTIEVTGPSLTSEQIDAIKFLCDLHFWLDPEAESSSEIEISPDVTSDKSFRASEADLPLSLRGVGKKQFEETPYADSIEPREIRSAAQLVNTLPVPSSGSIREDFNYKTRIRSENVVLSYTLEGSEDNARLTSCLEQRYVTYPTESQ